MNRSLLATIVATAMLVLFYVLVYIFLPSGQLGAYNLGFLSYLVIRNTQDVIRGSNG